MVIMKRSVVILRGRAEHLENNAARVILFHMVANGHPVDQKIAITGRIKNGRAFTPPRIWNRIHSLRDTGRNTHNSLDRTSKRQKRENIEEWGN